MPSKKTYRRRAQPVESGYQVNPTYDGYMLNVSESQQMPQYGVSGSGVVRPGFQASSRYHTESQGRFRPHYQADPSSYWEDYTVSTAQINGRGRGRGRNWRGRDVMTHHHFFSEQASVPVMSLPGDLTSNKDSPWTKKTLYAMVKAFVDDPNANEMSFPPTLTAVERHMVHKAALNFNLHHRSSGSKSERVLTLRKIGSIAEQQKDREFAAFNGIRVKTIDGYQGAQRLPSDYVSSKLNAIDSLVRPFFKKMYRQLKFSAEKGSRSCNLAIVQPGLSNVPQGNVPPQRYQELQKFRKGLPSYRRRDEIIDAVKRSSVVVVSGDTGCGKTTQIPQMLYDADVFPKEREIICTQPRRISALSVAQRVAEERGEACGDSCGYIIRFDNTTSSRTKIVYMTTGILLRRLHTDPELNGVSCIIVDEVHERDVETDFCLLLLRDRLLEQQRNSRLYKNHIKVIVMSATVQIEKVTSYFTSVCADKVPPVINIPGTLFPVQEYFLEEALEWTQMPVSAVPAISLSALHTKKNDEKNNTENGDKCNFYEKIKETVFQEVNMDPEVLVPYDLVLKLISHIHTSSQDLSESILVFLPGWASISRITTMIQRSPFSRELSVLQLHSSLTAAEQQRVFYRPPKGYRKLVLSTNIAETSVTIDDIVYVIDSCLTKGVTYDPSGNTSALKATFMSKANGLQRRGRAGRCRAGVCVHLLPKPAYESLPEFFLPEIVRTSLEEVCLQAKALKPDETCLKVLSRALDSPPADSTEHAINFLKDIGAFTREKEELTNLGRALSKLPIHPLLGKMLLTAACLGVLDPIATIAAYLSGKSPFIKPLPHQKTGLRQVMESIDNGLMSDHLCVIKLFDEWKNSNCSTDYAMQHYADVTVLRSMDRIRKQLLRLVRDSSLLRRVKDPIRTASRYSNNIGLIRMAALWSLYPCIASVEYRVKRNRKKPEIYCWDNKAAQLTMGSVLATKNRIDFDDRSFVFYHERMQLEANLTLFDATAVTPVEMVFCLRELIVRPLTEVSPAFLVDEDSKMGPVFPFTLERNEKAKDLAVLFFDGDKKVYVTETSVALVLRDLRECMDYFLALAIKNVRADLFPDDLIRALAYTIGYPLKQVECLEVDETCGNAAYVHKEYDNEEMHEPVIVSHSGNQLNDDSVNEDDVPEIIMEDFDSLQLTDDDIRRATSSFGELAVFNRFAGARLLGAFERGEELRQLEPKLNKTTEGNPLVLEKEGKDSSADNDDYLDDDDEDDDIIVAKVGELVIDDDNYY